jgi:hypothetical protein
MHHTSMFARLQCPRVLASRNKYDNMSFTTTNVELDSVGKFLYCNLSGRLQVSICMRRMSTSLKVTLTAFELNVKFIPPGHQKDARVHILYTPRYFLIKLKNLSRFGFPTSSGSSTLASVV